MMNLRLARVTLGLVLAADRSFAAAAESETPYHVTKTLRVGGAGGWDYVLADSGRLYVSRSTHVQVVEAETGKLLGDIPGQKHNHGIAVVPNVGRGFITDGDDGSVVVFDLKTNEVLGKIKTAEDADGILFDKTLNKVILVCGDAGSMFTFSPDVDLKTGKADEAIDLGGKPEFFAVDESGKAYVNLVDKDAIAVVDLKQRKVIHAWPTKPGGSPTGMALDPKTKRIYIGCRKPARMVVMSTEEGKIVADLPIGNGVDFTIFDNGYAFASCADGTLTVVGDLAGKPEVVQVVKTSPGSRTMAVDPSTHVIFLPAAEMEPAANGKRPRPKADSFMLIEVEAAKK